MNQGPKVAIGLDAKKGPKLETLPTMIQLCRAAFVSLTPVAPFRSDI